MAMLTHLNPDGLPTNPAFSQAVAIECAARTVYAGGQNGVSGASLDAVAVAGGAG